MRGQTMDRQTTATEYGRTKVEGIDVGTALRWLENETGLVFDGDDAREMTDDEREERGLYRGHGLDEVTEDGIVEAEHGKTPEDTDKDLAKTPDPATGSGGPDPSGRGGIDPSGKAHSDHPGGEVTPEQVKANAEAAGADVMTAEELAAKGARDKSEAEKNQDEERHALEGADAHTPSAKDPHHDEVIAAIGAEKNAENAEKVHAERHALEGEDAHTEPNLDPKPEGDAATVASEEAGRTAAGVVTGATGERAADGDADRAAKTVGGDGPLGAPSGEVVVGSKETGDKAAVNVPETKTTRRK